MYAVSAKLTWLMRVPHLINVTLEGRNLEGCGGMGKYLGIQIKEMYTNYVRVSLFCLY